MTFYIKGWTVLLILLLSMTSCNDFLNLAPQGIATDQNFYNDPENAVLSVNAVYEAMTRGEGQSPFGWLAHNYEFMFGDILSDDAAKGSTPGDYLEIKQMEEWQNQTNSGIAAATWTNQFRGIFRANQVLLNLPNATIDEVLKARLMGEAHFLRGYYYFYLAKVFGGAPIFENGLAPEDIPSVQRATVAETFAFAEKEFRAAIEGLPAKSSYATADMGRATKGAAQAYLSRIIMYQIGLGINNHNWQEVFDLSLAVVSSNEYALESNYAQIFEEEGENGIESIFEIQMTESLLNGNDQASGTVENVFQNNRSVWGWGFNNPTQNLVDEFESGDPRKACTVYADGDVVLGEEQAIDFPNANETGYLNRKAAIIRPTNTKGSGQNIRKMRYADVLLMHAEAAYHIGQESTARDILNQIRDRARSSTRPLGSEIGNMTYVAYTTAELEGVLPPVTASGTALLEAIYHERRVELGMEALRTWDLIRTGRFVESLPSEEIQSRCAARSETNGLAVPYPVQPIPQDEVDSWGLLQNPGY